MLVKIHFCSNHRWKDTAYKGKVFLPLSSAEDKVCYNLIIILLLSLTESRNAFVQVVTQAGEKDEKKTFVTTWSTKLPSDGDERPYYMKSNRFY